MVCYLKGSENKQKSSPALQNKLFECLPPGLFWLGASKQYFKRTACFHPRGIVTVPDLLRI